MPMSSSKLVIRIVNPKMDMNFDEEWSIGVPTVVTSLLNLCHFPRNKPIEIPVDIGGCNSENPCSCVFPTVYLV